jgi:hypothetical protein
MAGPPPRDLPNLHVTQFSRLAVPRGAVTPGDDAMGDDPKTDADKRGSTEKGEDAIPVRSEPAHSLRLSKSRRAAGRVMTARQGHPVS